MSYTIQNKSFFANQNTFVPTVNSSGNGNQIVLICNEVLDSRHHFENVQKINAKENNLSISEEHLKRKILCENTPLGPYKIIKFCAHHCLKEVIAAVMKCDLDTENSNLLVTSCVNTAYTVMKIFLGSKLFEEKESDLYPYCLFDNTDSFDFNTAMIDLLRETMQSNQKSVTRTTSFLYGVDALLVEQPSEKPITTQHIFLLEQFLSTTNKVREVRYRPYQSMIEKETILDEFHKRKYEDLEEGTWDANELNLFLDKLQKQYENNSFIDQADKSKNCFGLEFYDRCNVSLSTFSASFNPDDALKNLSDLLKFQSTDHPNLPLIKKFKAL
jgi:hypothetical protein